MKIYKKSIFGKILLLIIFMMLLYSCEKKNETFEENDNGQSLEQKSTDIEENGDKLLSDDSEKLSIPPLIKPRVPGFRYDDSEIIESIPRAYDGSNQYNILPYEYNGYWSMRFGEYFRLDDRNKDSETIMEGNWL